MHKNNYLFLELQAQWLRVRAPTGRGPGFIPGQQTRSHCSHTKDPYMRNQVKTRRIKHKL